MSVKSVLTAGILGSIGAVGFARTHALGALSRKTRDQIVGAGQTTLKSRSEGAAPDTFVEGVAQQLKVDLKTKPQRDSLYEFIKLFRRAEIGLDLVTQMEFATDQTVFLRPYIALSELVYPWVVIPVHPAVSLRMSVGPALSRGLMRAAESIQELMAKKVYLSVPGLYNDVVLVAKRLAGLLPNRHLLLCGELFEVIDRKL